MGSILYLEKKNKVYVTARPHPSGIHRQTAELMPARYALRRLPRSEKAVIIFGSRYKNMDGSFRHYYCLAGRLG